MDANMKLNYNNLKKLTQTIGDSFYILDVEKFRNNYAELKNVFCHIYPKTEIAYSYKTNYIPHLCKVVRDNDGYAEVVSEMEYDLALSIGADPLKIVVNGPYKPPDALKKFLLNGSIVNLDSYVEFDVLKMIAKKHPEIMLNIGIRCNFSISGLPTSRFGFDVKNPSFNSILEYISNTKNIRFKILHCHYPNREPSLFGERVDNMVELYNLVSEFAKPPIIDIGGGLGGNLDDFIKQQLPYEVADYSDYAKLIATKFRDAFLNAKNGPVLMLEPGTALVADTMKFVCKVIDIKNIRGQWIAMTSGTKINFSQMASKLCMPLTVFSSKTNSQNHYSSIDISGYTCMENDYLFRNYSGTLHIGDYLVFDNVGSYSVVFKPPFILPNVPVVSFINDKMEILKQSETVEYIFQTYKM